MKNINIILCRIRPHIQFNYSYTSLQCFYDRNITTVTAELIPSKVGIVACVYEIMGQRGTHIVVHLKREISPSYTNS